MNVVRASGVLIPVFFTPILAANAEADAEGEAFGNGADAEGEVDEDIPRPVNGVHSNGDMEE